MSKEIDTKALAAEADKPAAQKVSKTGSFIAGGMAACIAVTVTNPIELVKTRCV